MVEETHNSNYSDGDCHSIANTAYDKKVSSIRHVVVLIIVFTIGVIVGSYLFAPQVAPLLDSDDESTEIEPTDEHGDESLDGNTARNTVVENGSGYYKIKVGVYYNDEKILGADLSSFQELANHWAKDDDNVYQQGVKRTFIDPETVKVYPYTYVADKSKVWVYSSSMYSGLEEIDADPSSFSMISRGYGKDNNNVYLYEKKIPGADPQTFTLLDKVGSLSPEDDAINFYGKDKDNVYYRASKIPSVDFQSFVYIGSVYAKDKFNVYYEGKIIAKADPDSFTYLNRSYGIDLNHVSYQGKVLDLAIDPQTFEQVGYSVIKDNQRVYFHDYYSDTYTLLQNADALTFQLLGTCGCVEKSCGYYYRDKNRIYIEDEPVEDLDVASFHYYGDYRVVQGQMPYAVSYAKDKNSIYYSCGANLNNANPATFQDLSDGYAKDHDTVWYLGKVLENADTSSFQSLSEGYAKDESSVYYGNHIIENADTNSFNVVVKGYNIYGKDRNNVYFLGRIIDGVDPDNCTIESCEPDR